MGIDAIPMMEAREGSWAQLKVVTVRATLSLPVTSRTSKPPLPSTEMSVYSSSNRVPSANWEPVTVTVLSRLNTSEKTSADVVPVTNSVAGTLRSSSASTRSRDRGWAGDCDGFTSQRKRDMVEFLQKGGWSAVE